MNTGSRKRRSGAQEDDKCVGEDEASESRDKVEHVTLSISRRGVEDTDETRPSSQRTQQHHQQQSTVLFPSTFTLTHPRMHICRLQTRL